MDLILGLDFGTSSTKAAIRAPYFRGGGRVLAVEWPASAGAPTRLLLPTRVFVDGTGTVSLEPLRGGSEHTDLKLRLIDAASQASPGAWSAELDEASTHATAYLALAMRLALAWFEAEERRLHAGSTPRWQVNLGMPSAGYDDVVLRAAYEHILAASWSLAAQSAPVTLDCCKAALRDVRASGKGLRSAEAALSVLPEVAAAVVGYAKSTSRHTGLHVLLDIGASTLDICSFVLHEGTEGDRYAFLTSEVWQLGAFRLHLGRLGHLDRLGVQPDLVPARLRGAGPLEPLPASVLDYLPAEHTASQRHGLESFDRAFAEECRKVIARTVMDLRMRRDPHSPHFESGLPVFMTGGGCRNDLYPSAFQRAEALIRQGVSIGAFKYMALPPPSSLKNRRIASLDGELLAVAFGLSFGRFDIGEIQAPSNIEDVVRRQRERSHMAYIDKDQV